MNKKHTFHIPVLGVGFSVDTPLKVAQHGIDSVISIVDDVLLEKLRKMYSSKYQLTYTEISNKMEDFRARRITAYLNMIQEIAVKKMEQAHKIPKGVQEIRKWIKTHLSMGSIDVNIMTKVDKENTFKGKKLPAEHNDAHAALRGYANSELESSVIFSAGMNPGLYSYTAQFDDFYPDESGEIKKKIVIKVSDFRSALIQGKYFAKNGLWVSEFRIESGLNCGGHAFATDGQLMGPILAEFRDKRTELVAAIFEVYLRALEADRRPLPASPLPLRITAQGGVGTAEEHQFLLEHYQIDSVGWGSPFLLVPEVTNVDEDTLQKLAEAGEDDLYLSEISPLGVPFNNLRNNSKDAEKNRKVALGQPGARCTRRFLAFNTEQTEKPVCTASREFQKIKIAKLKAQELPEGEHQHRYQEIVEKACLCTGLGASSLLVNELDTHTEGQGVAVCPGPNLAYFSRIMTLKQMMDHIYGKVNMIVRDDRPNMFIKELNLYLTHLKKKIDQSTGSVTIRQKQYLSRFTEEMKSGVAYYRDLFGQLEDKFKEAKTRILEDLEQSRELLSLLSIEIEELLTPERP